MPKKPRTPAEKYRRHAKNVHLKNLQDMIDDLLEYQVFLVGESDSANELAVKVQLLATSIGELKRLYQDEIIKWM